MNLTLANFGTFLSLHEGDCFFLENTLFVNRGTMVVDCTVRGESSSIENEGIWAINRTNTILDIPFLSHPNSSFGFVLNEDSNPLLNATNLTINGDILLLRDYPYWPEAGNSFDLIYSLNPISGAISEVRSNSSPSSVTATVRATSNQIGITIDQIFLVAQDDFAVALEGMVFIVLIIFCISDRFFILKIICHRTECFF